MESLAQPEMIFTHESDLDGFVSGCLLQRLSKMLFDQPVPVEPLSSNPWGNLKRFPKHAWVSDLAFTPKLDRPGWLIVDHHHVDQKPRFATLIHDSNCSATKLCYQILLDHSGGNEVLERLVHFTNIADLHISSHADFTLASDYARLLKSYHFRPLYKLINSHLESLVDHPLLELMQLKRKVEDPIGLDWSRKHITNLGSQIGYVATTIGDVNSILHKLLDDSQMPFNALMTFFKRPGRPIALSIRSRNGEALKLAKRLHGGGHPNAAGASLPRSIKTFDGATAYLKGIFSPISKQTSKESTESNRESKPDQTETQSPKSN